MTGSSYQTDVVIAGGGLAGMAAACQLLDAGKRVLIVDRDTSGRFGGLARESFGGIHLIDTPHQRRLGLRDSPELALADWESYAEFGEDATLPRQWAGLYCEKSTPYIYEFLEERGVKYLPLVNWPERGLHRPGNSVPRWHIAWGTGFEIVERVKESLRNHPRADNLETLFRHKVSGLQMRGGATVGLHGTKVADGRDFRVEADHVIVASGGICGGDLSRVRTNWDPAWGSPPEKILNGSHEFADGLLHDVVAEQASACITNLDKQWHYAAGVHHPAKRRPDDGLSLVPPRSGLWFNAEGRRIMNPAPLVAYTDTRHLVESILAEPGGYSWQVLNWKIAIKELAVSGCDFMTAFREKNRLKMVSNLLLGNKDLVRRLLRECSDDFVTADSLDELGAKMSERSLYGLRVDIDRFRSDVGAYDGQIERGEAFFNDDQLRRIMNFRTYRGDRVRTCKFQKIDDPKARPLIAIREFILSRKSLGGIQTDLGSRVLDTSGRSIPGLFAIGESAGFGGGGIHGKRSLEGTFLGSCILTGRVAGETIASGG